MSAAFFCWASFNLRGGCFLSLVTEEGLIQINCSPILRLEDKAMTNEQKAMIDSLRSQGHGYRKISAMTSISLNTVKSYFRRAAVPTEKMPATAVTIPTVTVETESEHRCKCCGKKVKQTAGRKEKKFCSDTCRITWWNDHLDRVQRRAIYHFVCPTCGRNFSAYGNAHRKYCSHACYIADRFGGTRS